MKKKSWLYSVILVGLMVVSIGLSGCGSNVSRESVDNSSKIVTDLTGREVKIKKNVERVAIIPIPWASLTYAVDGTDAHIVGMNPSAKASYEKSILKRLAPKMADVNSTFTDSQFNVNFEETAKLKPDVVIAWSDYPDTIKKLTDIGIPTVAIKYGTLEDVQNGIKLLGDIFDKQDVANKLIKYHQDTNNYLKSKASALEGKAKTRVLYLKDDQLTVSTGASVNKIMIELAGGENLGDKTNAKTSWTKVTMEEVMKWDPEVVIISNFSNATPEEIYNNQLSGQDWSQISAFKNKRIYKAPQGTYRWDAPCAETPLMIKWIAKILHPDVFTEYNLRDDMTGFYKTFYNYDLTKEDMDQILNVKMNPDLGL